MKTTNIYCDKCQKQLNTESSYPHRWILKVARQDVNVNTSGIEFAVYMRKPIENELHFCGTKCLVKYFSE